MTKIFNKLIRDKIPEIIVMGGEVPKTRISDDEEFAREVDRKILEEAGEVVEAKTREEVLKELADLKEISFAKAELFKITDEEIEIERAKRADSRGAFLQKIYLETTEEN